MARQTQPTQITLLEDMEKCEKEVVERLLQVPDQRHVQLFINSGGGSVYASLGITTVMRMKRLQAEAIVLADCSSSAILVFATCQVRRVAPHASFLFHPMKWSSEDQARLPAARSWAAEFQRVNAICEELLSSNLGIPLRVIRQWMRDERYILASELIEMGVAEQLNLDDPQVIDISRRVGTRKRPAPTPARPSTRIRRAG